MGYDPFSTCSVCGRSYWHEPCHSDAAPVEQANGVAEPAERATQLFGLGGPYSSEDRWLENRRKLFREVFVSGLLLIACALWVVHAWR